MIRLLLPRRPPPLLPPPSPPRLLTARCRSHPPRARLASSSSSNGGGGGGGLSQRPNSKYVSFPGAVSSEFTGTLRFATPGAHPSLPTYRVVDQHGAVADPDFRPDLSADQVAALYTDMLYISILDPIMFDAQRQGRISFYMVSQGEEAVSVGSASALTADDVVYCQYREQGVFRQRGFSTADFMNQLFANRHDPGRGRNMPIHYGSRKLNIHSISSPLGTQLPQAAGSAYALKMQRRQDPALPARVVAAYFGEGAASEGDFHAALNMAATRSCPVIFICRNNGFAISTPTLEQYRGDGIASRGIGYGIDTIRVDGNDFWAVRRATALARQIALGMTGGGGGDGGGDGDGGGAAAAHPSGEGCRPVLIEAMTYRVSHHSTSDDSFAYRPRVEVEDWKRRDNPLGRLRRWMEAAGLWDESREREARARIRAEVLRGFADAEREKKPALGSMFEDVYAGLTADLQQQRRELLRVMERYPDEYEVGEFEGGKESLR